ncbi:MAG: repeat containing protein [Myxococcales bacterium]|nr:repeat containing protein [Myxococcales bacterium]
MRSSFVLFAVALWGGCSTPVVVVDVQNPQGLAIAREQVRVDWTGPTGETRTATHDFAVNANLGTFAIKLVQANEGVLRVSVEFDDATGATVGRSTGTVQLTGKSRTDLALLATRFFNHPQAALVGGQPGGPGDRDGPTGPDPTLAARLDEPISFVTLGKANTAGAIALVLEACGSIRRVSSHEGSANQVDRILPCSRHTAPASQGLFRDLSLDAPTTMVVDPYGPTLYIADGARILAVNYPSFDADPATLTYYDFTAAKGLAPMRVADLALSPYRARRMPGDPPYNTLFVADDLANVVWAVPIGAGVPTIAVGQLGPCVATLPFNEQAQPPVATGAPWAPGPYIAPDQAHLCAPSHIDTGGIGGTGSDSVLFVADSGHGNMRMVAPNALGAGTPGVTTLFDGYPNLQAFGYRFLGGNVIIANTDIGAMFFWNQDRLNYFVLYANPTIAGVGATNVISANSTPGFTERFNILAAIGAAGRNVPLDIGFDGVTHVYRVSDGEQGDAVVSRSFMVFPERNNHVVEHLTLNLDVEPWVGAGRHLGRESASTTTVNQPLFAAPIGLAWNGNDRLFVADRDNHAVAALQYNGSAVPLAGVSAQPLVGCPRSAGDVDGPAATAMLSRPTAVAYDAAKSVLYVLDASGTAVRHLQLDGDGTATEIHTLFAADSNDGTSCAAAGDGGPAAPAAPVDGGVDAPGLLGTAASMTFDARRRTLWLSHVDTPDLVVVNVDDPSTPKLVALPSDAVPGGQLAVIDATLFVVGRAGQLSAIDLLAATPTARSLTPLMLPGPVTAAGTDGEWLYVADESPRVWRVDPLDVAAAPTLLVGDGAHGVVVGSDPGVNQIGGFAYDAVRGVLLLADTVENVVLAIR